MMFCQLHRSFIVYLILPICLPSKVLSNDEPRRITPLELLLQQRQDDESVTSKPKIYGGTQASPGDYPWFARPTTKDFKIWDGCGGSLISSQFVLTAGHCVSGYKFGTIDTDGYQIGALCSPYLPNSNCGQDIERIYVKDRFIHPNYSGKTLDFDFTLISLTEASTITPVDLDDGSISDYYPDGKELKVAGFGAQTYAGMFFPDHLMKTYLSYVEDSRCIEKYKSKYGDWILPSMICTSAGPPRDSLSGDSGGPLYDSVNSVLVGVVSWGVDDLTMPGVYSRVSSAYDWIVETVCTNHDPTLSQYPKFCGFSTKPPTNTPTTSNPTISNEPSITPSYFPTNAPSISNMPSTSPAPTEVPYYEIETFMNLDERLCLQPKFYTNNAPIVLKSCNTNDLQHWSFNEQHRTICNKRFPARCIRTVKGNLRLLTFNPKINTAKYQVSHGFGEQCVFIHGGNGLVWTIMPNGAKVDGFIKQRPNKKMSRQCWKLNRITR